MYIETKFNIGDQIFVVDQHTKHVFIDCKICDGTGIVKIKNKEYECPECNGEKGIEKYKDEFFVIEKYVIIHEIIITRQKIIQLYSDSLDDIVYESDCFSTEEEAVEECVKRNKNKRVYL
jgi:hypothetical protein